jgi:hypothetical protein
MLTLLDELVRTTPAHFGDRAGFGRFVVLRLRAARSELLGRSIRLGNYVVLVQDPSHAKAELRSPATLVLFVDLTELRPEELP